MNKSLTKDVIIVTKNRHEKLLRTAACIAQNAILPKTIIIIDSSENCPKWIYNTISAISTNKNIKLIYRLTPDKGISYARNTGIRLSKSDIICFIDDDEIPKPSWLSIIHNLFRNVNINVICGPKIGLYPNNYWNQVWNQISTKIYPKKSGWVTFVSAGNSCYRRKFLLSRNYFFDERMTGFTSEDSVMSTKLFQDRIPIYFSKRLSVKHEFRVSFKGFIKQWFWYGVGTYQFIRLNRINRSNQLSSMVELINIFWFSRSQTQPRSIPIYYVPGYAAKEIAFSLGFLYALFFGK
jgi:glycosyltransferase involved in cell wall biosynthesis